MVDVRPQPAEDHVVDVHPQRGRDRGRNGGICCQSTISTYTNYDAARQRVQTSQRSDTRHGVQQGRTATMLRPPRFASYKASSARPRNVSSESPGRAMVTPMLTVIAMAPSGPS